jgi:hypothetical protein
MMPSTLFCKKNKVTKAFKGKSVAIVGSGPSSLTNPSGFIDSHDVVVRVNNYKLMGTNGRRTDVYYSFFGTSIKKSVEELQQDGVFLCICKCPNDKPLESQWHESRHKFNGIDFRYIYEFRKDWWFCDTYIPTNEEFLEQFNLLSKHIPTTGFSAILEVLKHSPKSVYITGFDFFQSGVHNVNERWRRGNASDPIGHRPEFEFEWLLKNYEKENITFDEKLTKMIKMRKRRPYYGY